MQDNSTSKSSELAVATQGRQMNETRSFSNGSSVRDVDLDMFWHWLTFKGKSKTSEFVESSKIFRVFTALDIFDNSGAIAHFVSRWGATQNDMFTKAEVSRGLALLTESQLAKMNRFFGALHARESGRKSLEEQEGSHDVNRAPDRHHAPVCVTATQQPIRVKSSASIHPSESNDNKATLSSINETKQSDLPKTIVEKVIDFFTKRFRRARTGEVVRAPAGRRPIETLEMEEGFTQRLTSANLSFLRADVCSNERIESYRIKRTSSISESLATFEADGHEY